LVAGGCASAPDGVATAPAAVTIHPGQGPFAMPVPVSNESSPDSAGNSQTASGCHAERLELAQGYVNVPIPNGD